MRCRTFWGWYLYFVQKDGAKVSNNYSLTKSDKSSYSRIKVLTILSAFTWKFYFVYWVHHVTG